jgi:hypothetical protein
LVSRDARSGSGAPGGGGGVIAAARRAAPLLLLGFGRLVATTSSGYVVPIGEYGAHWNFFFTLAAVALLAAAAPPARAGGAGAAAAAVLCAHALALHAGGLAAWLDAPGRGSDVLSQNREGIVSVVRTHSRAAARICALHIHIRIPFADAHISLSLFFFSFTQPGYWGIYLGGVAVGRALFSAPEAPHGHTALRRVRVLASMRTRATLHTDGARARACAGLRAGCGAVVRVSGRDGLAAAWMGRAAVAPRSQFAVCSVGAGS